MNEQASPENGLNALIAEYAAWIAAQGLEHVSADELRLADHVTDAQNQWLGDFIERWEAASRADLRFHGIELDARADSQTRVYDTPPWHRRDDGTSMPPTMRMGLMNRGLK